MSRTTGCDIRRFHEATIEHVIGDMTLQVMVVENVAGRDCAGLTLLSTSQTEDLGDSNVGCGSRRTSTSSFIGPGLRWVDRHVCS